MNCTFDPSRNPFKYFDLDRNVILEGVAVAVDTDTPEGTIQLCVYNTTACLTSHNCCEETSFVDAATTGTWVPPLVTFVIGYALCIVFAKQNLMTRWGVTGPMGFGAIQPKKSTAPKTTLQKVMVGTFVLLYFCSICALVAEAVIMPASIQESLPPADRSSQLAMRSFLAPVEEIFSFLEDTMTVKVGYAVAAMNYSELNALLHIGVFGGAISGFLAFVFTTFVAFFSGTSAAVLNPSHASNQVLIDGGCSLVPTTEQILAHAHTYWVLLTLSWIPKFAAKAVFGFLVGAGRLLPFVFASIVQATVPITLWFVLKETMPPLDALGISYGTADWLLAFIFFTYFYCSKKLRDEYQIRCMFCCCTPRGLGSSSGATVFSPTSTATTPTSTATTTPTTDDTTTDKTNATSLSTVFREVVVGGVQLMVVDLSVQMSITITIYLAASQHLATGYKLAASQAAYWSFGPSYLVGINMMLKLIGSRLMGRGETRKYLIHFVYVAIVTTAMAIGAVWLGASLGVGMAWDFGSSACLYAGQGAECARVYAGIFLGSDSLGSLMSQVLGPTVGAQLFFMLVKTALATCHDFHFMAKASVGCFVVGYVPSILYAHFVSGTTSSYFLAMFVPHFLMIAVFGVRMWKHAQCILADQPGPWTMHLETLDRKRSMGSFSEGVVGVAPESSSQGRAVETNATSSLLNNEL